MTEEKHSYDSEVLDSTGFALLLWNDDTTPFQVVILALMNELGWTNYQAEQAATIAHHKGKYKIKSGTYEELETLKYKLEAHGLTLEITN